MLRRVASCAVALFVFCSVFVLDLFGSSLVLSSVCARVCVAGGERVVGEGWRADDERVSLWRNWKVYLSLSSSNAFPIAHASLVGFPPTLHPSALVHLLAYDYHLPLI